MLACPPTPLFGSITPALSREGTRSMPPRTIKNVAGVRGLHHNPPTRRVKVREHVYEMPLVSALFVCGPRRGAMFDVYPVLPELPWHDAPHPTVSFAHCLSFFPSAVASTPSSRANGPKSWAMRRSAAGRPSALNSTVHSYGKGYGRGSVAKLARRKSLRIPSPWLRRCFCARYDGCRAPLASKSLPSIVALSAMATPHVFPHPARAGSGLIDLHRRLLGIHYGAGFSHGGSRYGSGKVEGAGGGELLMHRFRLFFFAGKSPKMCVFVCFGDTVAEAGN